MSEPIADYVVIDAITQVVQHYKDLSYTDAQLSDISNYLMRYVIKHHTVDGLPEVAEQYVKETIKKDVH